MKLQPTEIKRLPAGIAIQWNDGYRSEYSQTLLRQKCPCARCDSLRQGKEPLRILPPDDFFEKLKLTDIQLVGRYAIRLIWSDGHRTGIYPFDLLRSLSSPPTNETWNVRDDSFSWTFISSISRWIPAYRSQRVTEPRDDNSVFFVLPQVIHLNPAPLSNNVHIQLV